MTASLVRPNVVIVSFTTYVSLRAIFSSFIASAALQRLINAPAKAYVQPAASPAIVITCKVAAAGLRILRGPDSVAASAKWRSSPRRASDATPRPSAGCLASPHPEIGADLRSRQVV